MVRFSRNRADMVLRFPSWYLDFFRMVSMIESPRTSANRSQSFLSFLSAYSAGKPPEITKA